MSADVEPAGVKIARGLVAGIVAGAIASFAMDRFQAGVTAFSPPSDDDSDPATVKAANGIAERVAGHDIPAAAKPLAGQAIHYALGIAMGAIYGVAAEFRPDVTAGYGAAFAIGSATLLDQAAVPAVGLGEPAWRTSPVTTLYSYVSHLVFGGVAELVRRRVRVTLVPSS